MEKLTKQQQIEVLENIDWRDMRLNQVGLCYGITVSIVKLFDTIVPWHSAPTYIPLFTRKNAIKLGGSYTYTLYWWGFDEEGYRKRKEFVNWIIRQLKLQIIYESTNNSTTD